MPLTVKECQNLHPTLKPYKRADSLGMYIEVFPNGSKYWRFKYRFGGKEKRIAFGVFPEVSLAEARDKRDQARKQLRNGIDPSEEKKALKKKSQAASQGYFGIVANNWFEHKNKSWATETARKARLVLDNYLIPKLGKVAISTISTADIKPTLLSIYSSAPNLAKKARQYCNQIIQYAIQDGLREDGRLLSLRGVLPSSVGGHMTAITQHTAVPKMLKHVHAISSIHTKTAILLIIYTAIRPGTAVSAEWSELNADFSEWHIPASKMKTKNEHITPLPEQIRPYLKELKLLAGNSPFVFPGERSPFTSHMHRDSLSKALRENGMRDITVTHGFRAMFRTLAREKITKETDTLEAQLAHAKKGEVQIAYDRTRLLDERHKIVQKWADYLDTLQNNSAIEFSGHKNKNL